MDGTFEIVTGILIKFQFERRFFVPTVQKYYMNSEVKVDIFLGFRQNY